MMDTFKSRAATGSFTNRIRDIIDLTDRLAEYLSKTSSISSFLLWFRMRTYVNFTLSDYHLVPTIHLI